MQSSPVQAASSAQPIAPRSPNEWAALVDQQDREITQLRRQVAGHQREHTLKRPNDDADESTLFFAAKKVAIEIIQVPNSDRDGLAAEDYGEPKNARSRWLRDEADRRHESVAALGEDADRRGLRGSSLVDPWRELHARL